MQRQRIAQVTVLCRRILNTVLPNHILARLTRTVLQSLGGWIRGDDCMTYKARLRVAL